VSRIVHASAHLLRRSPAVWLAAFLTGALAVVLLAVHAPAWDGTDALPAVLAFGLAGLAFPLGWVGLEFFRQALAVRRRRLAAVEQRTTE
jgi:hypothetical protein